MANQERLLAKEITAITAKRKKHEEAATFFISERNRSGVWGFIDEVMKYLLKNHKQEMDDAIRNAKFMRETAFNKFGESKETAIRQLGAMPVRLEHALKAVYPEGLPMDTEKFYLKFFTKYPEFSFREVIS